MSFCVAFPSICSSLNELLEKSSPLSSSVERKERSSCSNGCL
uniref:Uncharacterized protein n=1 Tax=Arundo donax TaxID=35708 RepID=A0A0A9GPG0_ARUDO